MKSKESGFGKRVLEGALVLGLTAGAANAKEALNKLDNEVKKVTDKDAPTLVDNIHGKTFNIVENPKNLKGQEAKESQEFDDWGFPRSEIESYQNVLKELMSDDLYKFLQNKEKEDGKKYAQYLDIEGTAFMDFLDYLEGYTAIKDSDGKVVKTTSTNDPDKIAKYTPAGGYSEKVRGFKNEINEYGGNVNGFKTEGYMITNLDTIYKNFETSKRILNRGKQSIANGIRETDTRTQANNAEGVITQPEVKDSLNRIGNNISQYFKDLRDNTVDPCILGTEFLIEDVAMMIKYFRAQGLRTSPNGEGKHNPNRRITLKEWRDIQVENPQYQTQSYTAQRAQETAARFGAVLIPEGQKVSPSIVDVE